MDDPSTEELTYIRLGCVMFEALTGTLPFKGDTALEIVTQQINAKAPSIVDHSTSEFPEGLEQIVARCLEKDPNNRFQSMHDLREELIDVLVKSSADSKPELKSATESKYSKQVVVLVSCIAICLVTLVANGIILVKKNVDETARRAKFVKNEGELETESSHVFGSLARPLIQEQLKKWKTGDEFKLNYQNFDNDLEEFSHFPAKATSINLENSSATGPGLAYLIRYPISFLSLNESSITNRAFLEIKHMTNLRELEVDNTSVTAPAFKELEGLNLDRLSVRLNKLDDEALKVIAGIKSLTYLQCGKNDKLTGKGYLELNRLPNFVHLDLTDNPIDLKTAKAISQLKIITLSLENTDVNDEALRELCAMPNLRDLILNDCKHVTGAGLKYLAKFPELSNVHLEATSPIGDKDVEFIKYCPKLKILDVRKTNITDKTMELVADSGIKNLCIVGCNITDRGLMTLLKNRHLKHLEIGSNSFSKEALENFERIRPGVLRINKSDGKKGLNVEF